MFSSIFKTLGKVISRSRDSVSESTDFLDDLLEKEYIYNGVNDIKEATGKVVEESGKLFQKSKDAIAESTKDLNLKDLMGESTKVTHRIKKKALEAGEHIKDRVTDKDAIYDSWEEAVEITRNLEERKDQLLEEIKDNFKKATSSDEDE